MSYTPYPSGDDRKENPHIVASNDLVTWEKVLNPDRALDEPAGNVPLKIYNSDAHIVYNDDLDRMEMYWRFVDDTTYGLYIYRMTSDNGVDWTEKDISAYSPNRLEKDYVSPAILYDNGTYKMWYVGPQNKVYYTESSDGLEWTNEQVLDVKYEDNTNTWHIDVIKSDIGYEMIAVSYDEWKNHNDMNLYYTSSKDGLNWETGKIILRPTKGTGYWDNRGIYRSTFVKINGTYLVYYGGTNEDLHHGLGLVYGKDIYNLKSTNVNFSSKTDRNKFAEKLKKELK